MKKGMIDIGNKKKTERIAKANAFIRLDRSLISRIKSNTMPKGNVLETARIAGIMAAKKTEELIPLCHNIEIEYAGMNFTFQNDGILIQSTVKATSKTGVEMEALTACSVAALCIYDMCKMFNRAIEISNIELIEKRGGKSGIYKKKEIRESKIDQHKQKKGNKKRTR